MGCGMALVDEITEKKRALDAARPLPLKAVADLADWYEAELTIACLLVEGQRLNRDEVLTVMEHGAVLRNRAVGDQKLALNHRKALELMARLSYQSAAVVTERTVTAFHGVLFNGIDDGAGRYRDTPLDDEPEGSPDPAKVRVSMSALSGWLRRTQPGMDTAFEAHHRLMAVRPFDQGNAAVALLLCNLILNRAGFPAIVVREAELGSYRDAVERAYTLGDKQPVRDVMLRLLNQSLDVCFIGAAGALADMVVR